MSESFTTLVKAIVQKHMLAPSEPVVALLASERGLRIETDRVHWHASTFITTPAFEIISIRQIWPKTGFPIIRGFAAGENGAIFDLNQRSGMRELWLAEPAIRRGPSMMQLLPRFQAAPLGFPAFQNLITDLEVLEDAVEKKRIAGLELLPSDNVHGWPDSDLPLIFCTFYFAPDSETRILKAGILRWHVVAGPPAHLDWCAAQLVSNAPSPRYDPDLLRRRLNSGKC